MNDLLTMDEDDFYSDEEEISLTKEQIAGAVKISDRAADPELKWQVYLSALAFYGFEAWLEDRDDELKIDTSECLLLSGDPAVPAATHLKINDFNVCVVAKSTSDGCYVNIPQSILKNPTETAQFYIIAEVVEEMSEVLMYGFLRADRLEEYFKAEPLENFSDGTCDLPINWLNLEFDELISYFRCFNPSAISLPKLVTADSILTDLQMKLIGGSINQVQKPLVQSQLQKLVPSHPIEVLSISKSSKIIIVSSSSEGINELCSQYQNGLLIEISGFSIESLKTLNNQASKSNQEKEEFSRNILTVLRNAGFLVIKLPDIRNIVDSSFMMSSKEVIERVIDHLLPQNRDLYFQTKSNSASTSNEYNKDESIEREIANQIAVTILDFRSK